MVELISRGLDAKKNQTLLEVQECFFLTSPFIEPFSPQNQIANWGTQGQTVLFTYNSYGYSTLWTIWGRVPQVFAARDAVVR
jgi:hypothetical protein